MDNSERKGAWNVRLSVVRNSQAKGSLKAMLKQAEDEIQDK